MRGGFVQLCLVVVCAVMVSALHAAPAGLGIFEGETDVGATLHPGSSEQRDGIYRIAGSGDNMWFTNDAFHFVWKKVSGDLSLAADVAFVGAGGNAHRKACLMIRQNLEPNSAYVDAALHGDGLTSLQYRETSNGLTHEVQANQSAPKRLQIDKRGPWISLSLAAPNEEVHPAGASIRVSLQEPFFVGLAVCAHDSNVTERALFQNVRLRAGNELPPGPKLVSSLETVPIASRDRRVIYWTTNRIEAPNWSRDGGSLFFNRNGRIYRLPAAGGEPEGIDTGFAVRCNNDHGLSPDGSQLVISDQSQERHSLIYIVPVSGGIPKRVTAKGPSYWHGWAPDGQTLAYCAERDGEFDIYTISPLGGEEKRLTTAAGLDDGPDYSPDGQWIYFNSERSGSMQLWRMRADGSGQEAVTSDEYNNWFPHPSPDGKWIVFLSYAREVKGHPENQDVWLRLLPAGGGKAQVLARLFGGQGTINVPSWSPDSRKVAFVSYQVAP